MPFDFSPYAAVFLDLDGTLYHEERALPGAAELVRRLRAEGRPYACLSNSTLSPQQVGKRLTRMGIDMPAERIHTAAGAAADYVLETFPPGDGAPGRAVPGPGAPRPRVFNLATEGIQDLLDEKVDWVTGPSDPCDAIIVGAAANVYATPDRQRTALYLARAGARLVGICADRVYPSPRGLELGTGALTHMLAYAANVTPVFTGKPERFFFDDLCAHLHVAPEKCLLIGDNPESDMAGAHRVGMRTMLVLTGIVSRADVERIPPPLKPDAVIEDLTDLL